MFLEALGRICLLAEGAGGTWWPLALFLAGLFLVMVLPRLVARRSRPPDDPMEKHATHEELRQSMDRLLVELQETAREINATIDTKVIVLNKLIEQADERIETLKGLERGGEHASRDAEVPPGCESENKASGEEELSGERAKRRLELEREICRLADEGKTDLEIARLTGTPRGEVELVLGLRSLPGEDTATEGRKPA